MISRCSGPRFDSLVNPYTGKPIDTFMSSSGGRVRFRSPETYTPYDYFPTAEEAYRHYDRVDGIEGMRSGKPFTCAYTGEPLVIEHNEHGYHYVGGFNPRMFYTRSDWLYFASMRDGVTRFQPAGDEIRITQPRRAEITAAARKHAAEMRTELTDEAIAIAEKSLSDMKAKGLPVGGSETVSMHVNRKGRGK